MSETTPSAPTTAPNAEAIEAWDGPLFERFVRYRHLLVTGLAAHGDAALDRYPPPAGGRAIDLGCGFGDTTQQIAALVGRDGHAVGVDASPRFIEAATSEAAEAGVENVAFRVADIQTADLGGPFDLAFSRMGMMFFTNPVAALRRVGEALAPGGRLVMVVWRRREDNAWIHRAQQIVEGILERPDDYSEPTCGPGPFSMADADTVTTQLLAAGFDDVALHRNDLPILIGRDVDEAIDLVMAIGPAGEIVRLWGDRQAHRHDEIRAALREGLGEFVGDGAVHALASTWTVSATRPPAGPAPGR